MNTPIQFPFTKCDHSDIQDIEDYTIHIQQGLQDVNQYWIPNAPNKVSNFNIIDTNYTTSDWDLIGNYLTPSSAFNGDTFSYINELQYYRRYWVELDIEITAGSYDLGIGGTTLTINTSSDKYTPVIGSGASVNIQLTFSSSFRGKFYGFKVHLLNEQYLEVSDNQCDSFTELIGTAHKNAISIEPFDTLQSQDKDYIISQKSFSNNLLSNTLSFAIPDNGYNYDVTDPDILLTDDLITFNNNGSAFTKSNLVAGEYYRLSFTYNQSIQVNCGALILGNFDTSLGDSSFVELDFIAIAGKLEFFGDGNIVKSVRLKTHLPKYSFNYKVIPRIEKDCYDNNELVKIKWRNNSDVGNIPYCDYPLYFNEFYFVGSVMNELPEDPLFENYTDGRNNITTAYSNQYDISSLVTPEPYTPIGIFNMLCLAAKQSYFTINKQSYKSVEAIGEAELSDNRKSVTNPKFKLVANNGNEINNCDC